MSIHMQPEAFDTEISGLGRDRFEPPVGIGLNPTRTGRGLFALTSIVDIPERRRLDHAASAPNGERLAFEHLVGELSMRFIDLPPTDVDAAIQDAQRRIVEALDFDRSALFQLSDDGDLFSTHSWCRPEVPALPARLSARESFPCMLERLRAGELVCLSSPDELPDGVDRATALRFDMKSTVAVPLSVARRIVGVVTFTATRRERQWSPEILQRVRLVASMFASVLARRHSDEALRRALAEMKRLSDQLHAEKVYLRREVESTLGTSAVVGQSAAIRRVQEQVRQVAETDATVLLLGETGSGKELFASQIHELSRRRGRAMVRVNCAAIPATLIESELFGREKGAYTGALSRQIGRFELSDGSTIFLDEIGDLPPDVQVKLLRVLEEKQIERLGSSRAIKVDTRIIAATHRDLEKRIEADTFREDLYYRLNVFPIRVPPLRERTEDIPMLVWRFVEDFSKAFGKRVESITKDNIATLQRYAWPGNVRELRNVVERAMIVANSSRLTIALPQGAAAAARRSVRLADVEKEHIKSVLDSTGWRIRGVDGAAERLGLKATTLETRMAKVGLQRPRH
jgi:formate hydrogenlyase transcriptional activator